MNELIKAAKAVIARWDLSPLSVDRITLDDLRAAVERAENIKWPHDVRRSRNPSEDLDQWLQSRVEDDPCAEPPYDEEIWTAAQQAERERIRARVRLAAISSWSASEVYIGPPFIQLQKFVDRLLEDGDE